MLEEELVGLMERHEQRQSTQKSISPRNSPRNSPARIQMVELEHLADEALAALEKGQSFSERKGVRVIQGVCQHFYSSETMLEELSTESEWGEVNLCGDFGGDMGKLWEMIHINGEPECDNQYVLSADFGLLSNSFEMVSSLARLTEDHAAGGHVLTQSPIPRLSAHFMQGQLLEQSYQVGVTGAAEHSRKLIAVGSNAQSGGLLCQ